MADDLISEDWLKEVGFKWAQVERQEHKGWLLWLGAATGNSSWTGPEDLGIEVAYGSYNEKTRERDSWFCFLRSDSSSRYHRFIHIRAIQFRSELIRLVEALSGQEWNPQNHFYGCVRTPDHAEHLRREQQRLDRVIARDNPKWFESEKDDSRSGPLREHLDTAIQSGRAK